MELKIQKVFAQKKPWKAQHADCVFSFELRGNSHGQCSVKRKLFFREAEDLPEI